MAIGAIDGQGTSTTITDGQEAISPIYGFQIDLNTSFTGEDSLDVSLMLVMLFPLHLVNLTKWWRRCT